ncbi:hypothetical protein OH687_28915 [Burkholderia anthina]|nr:hypothetical protein OH687_28915 [Burkholderia anthina]
MRAQRGVQGQCVVGARHGQACRRFVASTTQKCSEMSITPDCGTFNEL